MPVLHLKYCARMVVVTGKMEETIETKIGTIDELISQLEEKYPGLRELFVSNDKGVLNLNSMIFLMRIGEPTVAVVDLKVNLVDGDNLILI